MNQKVKEALKREEFQKKLDYLMSFNYHEVKLHVELKKLIATSHIDISYPYKDTVYETVVE